MRAHLKGGERTPEDRCCAELLDIIQDNLGYVPDWDKLLAVVDEMLPVMQMSKPDAQWHVYAAAIFAAFEGEFRQQHRWVPGAHRGPAEENS